MISGVADEMLSPPLHVRSSSRQKLGARSFAKRCRPVAILIAAATIVAACGSTTDSTPSSSPASSSSAHIADCIVKGPGPSTVDDAFADISGFTVDHICPGDVDPTLEAKSVDFSAVNAGKVIADDKPVLSVFAGQLKGDGGDAFVRTLLTDMGARVAPKTLATESKDVGGYSVTHFNVPGDVDGYAYFEGPTVVVAHDLAGGQNADSAEKALTAILSKVYPKP
jgi:hypothetical protein